MNNARKFWETCRSNYAHLKENWSFDNNEKRTRYLHSVFINHIDFIGKTVVDYGVGGGFLGLYLFENYDIKKYIAIDIAERSLILVRRNLEEYNIETHLDRVLFDGLGADIFATLSTIQHFPDKDYLDSFLKKLNESKIKTLVLHYRVSQITVFNDAYDTKEGNKGIACRTNINYILHRLTNYTINKVTENGEGLKKCEVAILDYTT